MPAPSFAPPAARPRSIGDYRVVCHLATGGMAEVFLAARRGVHDFARPVVVKRLLPHLVHEADLCASIVDEARILSRVRHPNVVQVEELGSDGTTYYLVLEYLRGDSISSMLRRLRSKGERLSPALAAHIASEACAGLHAAHELTDDEGQPLGVVHRDVSPHNVFITFEGEVKVIDFGIARFDHRAAARTRTGIAKGKFAYMAPEQFSGEGLDRRADVFALGAVLHELLTGERLFARDNDVQVLKAILHDPVAPPSENCSAIPASLDAVCMQALRRAPEDRYPTADALRAALHELMPIVDPSQRAREELAPLVRRVLADRWQETEEHLRCACTPLRPRPARVPACEDENTPSAVAAQPHERATLRPPDRPAEPVSVSVVVEAPRPRNEPSEAVPAARPTPLRARAMGLVLGVGACVALGAIVAGGFALEETHVTPPAPPSVAHRVPPAPIRREALPPALPSAAPAPGSQPVPPATVRVRVETTPRAAQVRRGERWLGATPLDVDLERATEPVELTIEREGYEPVHQRVLPTADALVRVRLARRPRAVVRGRPPDPAPRFYSFDAPAGSAAAAAERSEYSRVIPQ